ncbi:MULTISPECIES: major capsid protein [Pseudomonas syringae group]|uniref:Methyltransferase n=1 Tax=Pseudomonas syringae pv. coriandricola TaxID=264453 RepID=A0A0P9M155_9PSED|nr:MULTISPECIES: major capsid protein [Pseudomonas syringae group]KPW76930.1 Unknown protein sequence [Pseudomonas syringae pv. coriandricola]RMN08834.1 hypothetical protein ALQ65_200154 [Pseudomonas syringae pv. coriandricola]
MKTLNRNTAVLSVAMAAMTFGTFALAEGEGAEIPGMVTAALATVGLIGAAVLAVYASIKIFKLVRAAI